MHEWNGRLKTAFRGKTKSSFGIGSGSVICDQQCAANVRECEEIKLTLRYCGFRLMQLNELSLNIFYTEATMKGRKEGKTPTIIPK